MVFNLVRGGENGPVGTAIVGRFGVYFLFYYYHVKGKMYIG